MTMSDQMEKFESLVAGGRVPGTSRCLVNVDKFMAVLEETRADLPEEISEAQAIIRQKEGVIKQAELEARRIRAYADDEATTIRQMAEEQSAAALDSAREQAHAMIQETEVTKTAEENAQRIISESEQEAAAKLEDADRRLNAILAEAEEQAEARRKGADAYAREVLFNLEERVADMLGQVRQGIDLLDHTPVSAA